MRYLLFAGEDFYPNRAWKDFKGIFHTIEDARRQVIGTVTDWYQIVDTTTYKIVETEADKKINVDKPDNDR